MPKKIKMKMMIIADVVVDQEDDETIDEVIENVELGDIKDVAELIDENKDSVYFIQVNRFSVKEVGGE